MKEGQITFEDYAGIVVRRFCISLKFAIKVLKALGDEPVKAFCSLAKMGDEGALDHIFRIMEER